MRTIYPQVTERRPMPRSRRWIPPKTSTSILSGIVNVSSKSQLRQCHSHRHIHNSYHPSRSIDQVISLTPKSEVRSKLLPRHKQRRTLLHHIRKPKMGTARYSRSRPKTTSKGRGGRGGGGSDCNASRWNEKVSSNRKDSPQSRWRQSRTRPEKTICHERR